MRWKIEDIGVHVNILMEDGKRDIDSAPVALGMPRELAKRIVTLHNEALDTCLADGECP